MARFLDITLIIEPIGFDNRSDLGFKRKKEVKDETKDFGPTNGKDGVAIYYGRSVLERSRVQCGAWRKHFSQE